MKYLTLSIVQEGETEVSVGQMKLFKSINSREKL